MTQTVGSDREERPSAPAAPPFGERWRYELYGHRLPEQYRAWAVRDIASRWWPWRQAGRLGFSYLLALVIVSLLTTFRVEMLIGAAGFVLVGVVITPLVGNRAREDARRAQGISGQPPAWVRLTRGQTYIAFAMVAAAAVVIALVFA